FQAEDGIRDFHVTGVQTCALPIFVIPFPVPSYGDPCAVLQMKAGQVQCIGRGMLTAPIAAGNVAAGEAAEVIDFYHRLAEHLLKIGRASCREMKEMLERARCLIPT